MAHSLGNNTEKSSYRIQQTFEEEIGYVAIPLMFVLPTSTSK